MREKKEDGDNRIAAAGKAEAMVMAMVTEKEGMQKSRQGGNNGRGNNLNCSPTIDTVYSINNNWFFLDAIASPCS